MFPIPWYAVLLISIPQTFLIIQIGFLLFNLRIGWKESIIASGFIGLAAYILPRLPLMPGAHTILLIFITTLITSRLGKVQIVYSFIAVICGAMIMGVIENVVMSLVLRLISKTASDLAANAWLNIGVFMPTLLLGTFIFLLVKSNKWVLYDLNTRGNL